MKFNKGDIVLVKLSKLDNKLYPAIVINLLF